MEELNLGVDLNKLGYYTSFENTDFSFRGELKTYDYNKILKDKQTHIQRLFELAAYYVDADDIVSGIVKRVLTPFSLSCGWKLKGTSEKTKKKFTDHYEATGFLDVARSMFYELNTFANCYAYMMPFGNLITLAPNRIRISDISANGEPVLEFNIIELNRKKNYGTVEGFIDTLIAKYKGYPPEIEAALKSGSTGAWIQLNPENTFVLQESKPLWQRYAIPFISTCLKPLAKKELISYYEDVQLNIGAKGFLHVTLGDNDLLPKPTQPQLNATAKIFQDALNKFPLAVTSHFVDAKFVAIDTGGLFDKSKYTEVNAQIMSSGGISPLIVTGESEGSSFAQANISIEVVAQRISQNQQNFAEMMKKYNRKLAEMWRISTDRIPTFEFNEIDLINDGKLREEAFALWQQGCISRKTLLNDYYNCDYDQELERKKIANESKEDEIFTPPVNSFTSNVQDKGTGAPSKSQKDSKTDKNKSGTGSQPKPSTK